LDDVRHPRQPLPPPHTPAAPPPAPPMATPFDPDFNVIPSRKAVDALLASQSRRFILGQII
ncbi:hypothetical protein, partial [Pseudoclavibacter sp. RFBG4]|uniref:hypothetical protein n=1 Tax=Pseudoclavibacter sp. RFBG4 TaxID=2080575 RepID=UPI001CA50B1B